MIRRAFGRPDTMHHCPASISEAQRLRDDAEEERRAEFETATGEEIQTAFVVGMRDGVTGVPCVASHGWRAVESEEPAFDVFMEIQERPEVQQILRDYFSIHSEEKRALLMRIGEVIALEREVGVAEVRMRDAGK